jgi:AcrR family transcriptional regulator
MIRDDTMSVDDLTGNRAERRKQETRARLLKSTEDLLYTEGYAALSIRKITDYADLGYGTFYLHFKDLDDAVWIVEETRCNQFTSGLIDLLAAEPPRRRIYLGWCHIFEDTYQYRTLFDAMYGRNGSAQLKQMRQDWIVQAFEAGMQAGHFQPHETDTPISIQAQFLAGVVLGMLCWWVETGCQQTPEEMATILYQMTYHKPPPTLTTPAIIARPLRTGPDDGANDQ